MTTYFNYGADKIILGSGSVIEGGSIENISDIYGSQSIIQSIDCKKKMKIISSLLKVEQS